MTVTRRDFLKLGALAGAGLLIGFTWGERAEANGYDPDTRDNDYDTRRPEAYEPNAFLRIGTDNTVTVIVPMSEMGQGVLTALAMIVAEELDCDWKLVRAEEAPAAKPYQIGILGQLTAGSESVRTTYEPLRKAGASARAMLVQAAAADWRVPADVLRTENGFVFHPDSARRASYGDLAAAAAKLSAPWSPRLKDPKDFRIIGQRKKRLDAAPKSNGTAHYGLDMRLPDMLIASVARCPVFGGKVQRFDAAKALAVPGVKKVFAISTGVAVLATNTWAARKGVEALDVTWDEGPNAHYSTAEQKKAFLALAEQDGRKVFGRGDADRALKEHRHLEAVYELPYMAHATMEPMNATAHVTAEGCTVWVGTQAQTATQAMAAEVTGFPVEKVAVNTQYLGGGFGRRAEVDFAREAVECSKQAGVPVKVVWNRPDDIHHDFYRPANTHKLAGALDAQGWPTAYKHHVVAQSVLVRFMPAPVYWVMHDPITFSHLGDDFPYQIPNVHVAVTDAEAPVPVGFWRSVGFSHNVYVAEHFLDELAAMGGKDPLEVRRKLMTANPRLRACLELAAEKAGWGRQLSQGHFHGLAACSPFGSHVAQVAEVSVIDGEVRVHRVVAAVDCGQVINPSIVEAQIESGIVYGISAALKGEVTLEHGRVQQSNFDSYPVLRMHEMPKVEVHLIPNANTPGGMGEVGVPCVAPAIANALLKATGKSYRSLPIRLT